MKAYFAVPLVKHRNKKNTKLIAKILNDLGIQIINNWILISFYTFLFFLLFLILVVLMKQEWSHKF